MKKDPICTLKFHWSIKREENQNGWFVFLTISPSPPPGSSERRRHWRWCPGPWCWTERPNSLQTRTMEHMSHCFSNWNRTSHLCRQKRLHVSACSGTCRFEELLEWRRRSSSDWLEAWNNSKERQMLRYIRAGTPLLHSSLLETGHKTEKVWGAGDSGSSAEGRRGSSCWQCQQACSGQCRKALPAAWVRRLCHSLMFLLRVKHRDSVFYSRVQSVLFYRSFVIYAE